MVHLPIRRKLDMSSETIKKLISKLKIAWIGHDWPDNFHPYWSSYEIIDPIDFARKTLWTACRYASDGQTETLFFWEHVTDDVLMNCMEVYRQLAIEKDFVNFIFREKGAVFQFC